MGEAYRRAKEWLALAIVNAVATMECAAVFAVLACISLPEAIHGGAATLIAWIAQTFLQLVLLSVIMVGQSLQQRRVDELHDKHDAVADFHEHHGADLAALHGKLDELHDHIKGNRDAGGE